MLVPDSDGSQRQTSLLPSIPEFKLLDMVDIADDFWQEHITHCLDALGKLGFNKLKSRPQLLATILVLHHLNNLILILPTGFGKSLLYLFLAMLPVGLKLQDCLVGGNTIIITPYTALLVDQYNKSQELGVQAFNWRNRNNVGNHVPADTCIIFIQPKSSNSRGFQE